MAKKGEIVKQGSAPAAGIVKWDEELAKYADDVASKEITPSGQFISVKGGILSFAGSPIKDNKMDVVVLDSIHENVYYEGEYDGDNPQPPVCYAYGREEKGMKPHPESPKPQSPDCASCKWNQFGSAERGKGKACKNLRRLAVISTNGLDAANAHDMEPAFVKISVMSVKGWALYVKGLNATFKRPPFAMVTKIGIVPDPKSQHRFTFEPVQPLDGDLMAAMLKRYLEFTESNSIMFPYPKAADTATAEAKPATVKRRKF